MTESEPIQRLHYFDHQFLREKDFTDEQGYHIRMRQLHNSALHTWGVAGGLTLRKTSDTRATLDPGVAIDGQGREIVLRDPFQVDPAGRTVFVTIAYGEKQTNSTTETTTEPQFTRWTEEPEIQISENPPGDPSVNLVLGVVTVDTNGQISDVSDGKDPNRRRNAGVLAGDLSAASLTLASPGGGAQAPILRQGVAGSPPAPVKQADLDGNLRVTGTVNGRNIGNDGTKLDQQGNQIAQHVARTDNPHATTAAQIDAAGGTNQIVTQINAGTGLIASKNIESGAGAKGWVRLSFLPKKFTPPPPTAPPPEFSLTLVHSTCGTSGASGNIEIPIPAGATRITRFRIAGTQNIGGITVTLQRINVSQATPPGVTNTQLLRQAIAGVATPTPFNVTLGIPAGSQPLDAELQALALLVEAAGAADIWFVAAEFA